MKRFRKKQFIIAAVFIIVACSSCQGSGINEDNLENQGDTVTYSDIFEPQNPPRNFSVTGCKSVTRDLFDEEYLEYQATEDGYLRITHYNSIFNCKPGRVFAELSVNSHEYIINEIELYAIAECVCPYDLSFDIGPMKEEEYTVIIRRNDVELIKFSITFNSVLKGQVPIKK